MSLKGSTTEFPLDILVRLLADTHKTGELTLRSAAGEEGALGVADGRVVTAVYGSEAPIPALGAIFALGEAQFEFTPWNDPPPANLEGELEENLRKADEYRTWLASVREVIPNDRVRFRLSERAAEQGAVTFTSDRWRAVLAVNGQRDVTAIAEHLRLARDAALDLLAGLVRDGVIETIEPESPPPPPAPPEPAPRSAAPEPAPRSAAPEPTPRSAAPEPATRSAAPLPEAAPWTFAREAAPQAPAEPVAPEVAAPEPRVPEATPTEMPTRWGEPAPMPAVSEPEPPIPQEWGPPPPPTAEPAPLEPPMPARWGEPAAPEAQAAATTPEVSVQPAPSAPEWAPAAPPAVDDWVPAVPVEPEPESAPMDDRLAALFGPAPAAPAPSTEAWTAPAAPPTQAETAAPDPRLGALFATPSAPAPAPVSEPAPPPANEWAPPPPVAPAPQKKGGLFGRFGRREEAAPAPAASTPTVEHGSSRAGLLAAFSNALLSEYNSGQYGKSRIDDRIPSLLMRVDEQADPIDRPLPVVDDRLDVQALERVALPEAQAAPYLALLVSTIYNDAEKAFGRDKAKRGYRAAQQSVFSGDMAAALSDLAGKLPKV